MPRAYIALGSNQADPQQQIHSAFCELDALESSRLLKRSPLYRSEPVGPAGQDDYVNAVGELETTLDPLHLLHALQGVERAHGRVRRVRWGPRTLDLDMLLYDRLQSNDPQLTLPHPRLHERLFVLQPLHDIAADLMLPGGLGSLAQVLARCPALRIERIETA